MLLRSVPAGVVDDLAAVQAVYKLKLPQSHWRQPLGRFIAVSNHEQRPGYRTQHQIEEDITELESTFPLVKFEE